MLEIGDKVRIKREWCNNEKERNYEYTVINVNEVTNRCIIETLLPGFTLPTNEVVGFNMIEKIEEN